MQREMWYYVRIAALKLKTSPVALFLVLHTILWCDAAWFICMGMYALMDVPPVLHSLDTLLAMAYSGIFAGTIGGAVYLMHEDLV